MTLPLDPARTRYPGSWLLDIAAVLLVWLPLVVAVRVGEWWIVPEWQTAEIRV